MTTPASRKFSKAEPPPSESKSFTAYPAPGESATSRAPYMRNRWIPGTDGVIVVVLTALCAFTRLYQIGRRAIVSWDESHFGKFGAFYVRRQWFHDVHPPLAKALIALSEVLAGHNGTFEFKGPYPDYVNYKFMRQFTAMFGIGLVPLAYVACHQLNMSRRACVLAACFVLLDNALCVMSRFILLDESLLFFTAATLCSVAGLQNARHQAFSRTWWRWLLLTGASLGLVASCKWVGFLTIALVGLYTIGELFTMYIECVAVRTVARHFMARVLCLIAIPFLIYAACFKMHFMVLNRSGSGDARMPPAFQASLKGSPLGKQPFTVMYDSQLTLRSMHAGSGILHSHAHRFPEGSGQQQITCYGHKDSNNEWIIARPRGVGFNNTADPPVPVRHGDVVNLMHQQTKAVLHAHRAFAAPVTAGAYEVTAYGRLGWKDRNNDWRVEIVREQSRIVNSELHAITTQFNLRHVPTGCLLSAEAVRLPSWGFGQTEVTCSRQNASGAATSLWVVEKHVNSRVPKTDMRKLVKRSFVEDFVELNLAMARSNNALVPDRDKHNHLESDAWSWPFLVYPMRLLGSWKEGDIKYYEVGNPLLWWSSALCCLLFPLQLLFHFARKQRGVPAQWAPGEELHYWNGAKLLWGGWALHYLPFFLFGRVLYLHHYLPSLYFALLLLAFEIDYFCRHVLRGRLQNVVLALWAVGALAVFCWFAPLTFGYSGAIEELKYRKWLPTWNIYEDRHVM
ncbi:Protein O-mannosyltransferase 2 [Coemansia sp. RSA 2706]|nr:Protein O-mannosyltransferase 2 [Coemansia sp. RSA 2706]